MQENRFLKVNIDGFHSYLDRVGDVVDVFYRKKTTEPVNFLIQNHKVIIGSPAPNVDRIEIDHKSIYMVYSENQSIEPVSYFLGILNEILSSVKFKCQTITRIGHATHYAISDHHEIADIKRRMFTSQLARVSNFNDVIFEIPISEDRAVQKIVGTPLDATTNQQVLLLNIDYFSTQPRAITSLKAFLGDSLEYLNTKKLEGLF